MVLEGAKSRGQVAVEEDYTAALHPHHVHVKMLGLPWCCTCSRNTTEQIHFAMLVVANKLTKARNEAGVGLHLCRKNLQSHSQNRSHQRRSAWSSVEAS